MRNSRRELKVIEFTLWVGTVAGGIIAFSAVLSFLFGDGLLTLKYVLFVIGVLMFGVGSFGIQPERPHKNKKLLTTDNDTEYAFEERIQDALPSDEDRLLLEERISRDTKIFVASIIVLGVSLFLEAGIGISS